MCTSKLNAKLNSKGCIGCKYGHAAAKVTVVTEIRVSANQDHDVRVTSDMNLIPSPVLIGSLDREEGLPSMLPAVKRDRQ